MKYTINYGFGIATLYTPHDPEERFYTLASTCFGIRKSIIFCEILKQEDIPCPAPDYERLEFSGDVYVWRKDGARKMLAPYPDDEWDVCFCEECAVKKEEKEMTPGLKITLFIILTLMMTVITYINGYLHGRIEGRVEGYAEALKDEEEANNHD